MAVFMSSNIQLPPDLYTQYQQLADTLNRSVEEVVIEELEMSLQSLEERLWSIVNQRLPHADRQRLHDLMDKNNQGTISEDETQVLDDLLEEVNRQMLERSRALLLLKNRGHDIDAYLKPLPDDSDF
jgi:hypothetical protein